MELRQRDMRLKQFIVANGVAVVQVNPESDDGRTYCTRCFVWRPAPRIPDKIAWYEPGLPGVPQKARKIDGLVRAARRESGGDGAGGGLVAYIGDSPTDLTALLAADVGILVGTSSSTRKIARRFGVRIAPLPAELPAAAPAGDGAVIYEAESWEQIGRALGLGPGGAAGEV